jgi:hypothetical protein
VVEWHKLVDEFSSPECCGASSLSSLKYLFGERPLKISSPGNGLKEKIKNKNKQTLIPELNEQPGQSSNFQEIMDGRCIIQLMYNPMTIYQSSLNIVLKKKKKK